MVQSHKWTEINEFVGIVGTALALSEDKKEIDFFSQIFPLELFDYIADETNIYATAKGTSRW